MKPDLEEILDFVMTQPHLQMRFDHVMYAGSEHIRKGKEKVLKDIEKNPDEFWKIDEREAVGKYADVLNDVHEKFSKIYFDVAQRKFYGEEKLYRKGDGFIVSSRPKGEPLKMTGSIRDTVSTLRNAGMKVRWPKEREIKECAAAVESIYHGITREAGILAQKDEARRREDYYNSPG